MGTSFIQSLAQTLKNEDLKIRIRSANAIRDLLKYGKFDYFWLSTLLTCSEDEIRGKVNQEEIVALLVNMIKSKHDEESDEASRVLYEFVRHSKSVYSFIGSFY